MVDFLFCLICIAVIAFLLSLKVILSKDKVEEYTIGNDQVIGARHEQQDSFATYEDERGIITVLADGMGGYSNGRLASSFVVKNIISQFKEASNLFIKKNFLYDAVFSSNRKLIELADGVKIGTTIAAAIVDGDDLYWVSVGDSAIAVFREGELINLNKKQNLEELLKEKYHEGKIDKEQLLKNPLKKRLTSFVGYEGLKKKDIDISEKPFRLMKQDRVILCSDGVYKSLSELELEKIIGRNNKPQKAVEEVTEMINKKNDLKQDNATIIIIQKN